jgi:hypothetical protein
MFLPLYTGRYNPALLEDLLPGIFTHAVTGNRNVFDEEVSNKCQEIPDSDLVAEEEESLKRDCEKILSEFSPKLKTIIGDNAIAKVKEKLVDVGSLEVEIVDRSQIVVEIKTCQEI